MAGEYHSLKKQQYLNLIKECAHSGKNKREWCSEKGIKYSTFMRWQALLRDEVAEQAHFAQKINKSPGFISLVETGRSNVSNNIIKSICESGVANEQDEA